VPSDDAGYRAMKQLLIDRPELTAVVVWSDVVAVGAISALRDAGRDIPGDVSLISFDRFGTPANGRCPISPSLTRDRRSSVYRPPKCC